MMFVVSAMVLLVYLILIDMHKMELGMNLFMDDDELFSELDEDVQEKMDTVLALSTEEIAKTLLVAKHLKKAYGKKIAVKDVTFTLEPCVSSILPADY